MWWRVVQTASGLDDDDRCSTVIICLQKCLLRWYHAAMGCLRCVETASFLDDDDISLCYFYRGRRKGRRVKDIVVGILLIRRTQGVFFRKESAILSKLLLYIDVIAASFLPPSSELAQNASFGGAGGATAFRCLHHGGVGWIGAAIAVRALTL